MTNNNKKILTEYKYPARLRACRVCGMLVEINLPVKENEDAHILCEKCAEKQPEANPKKVLLKD